MWLPYSQVRKLRSDYGLTKQRPHLFISASNPAKAEVLERSKLEVGHCFKWGTHRRLSSLLPLLLLPQRMRAALCSFICLSPIIVSFLLPTHKEQHVLI